MINYGFVITFVDVLFRKSKIFLGLIRKNNQSLEMFAVCNSIFFNTSAIRLRLTFSKRSVIIRTLYNLLSQNEIEFIEVLILV